MGYFKHTVLGFSWLGAFRALTRAMALVRTAILARLLLPADFGIFGIATLSLAFLEILTETGINVFLIQEKKDLNEYVSTAWIISQIRGLLMTTVLFFGALPISRFFNAPQALPLLRLVALVPLIKGMINPAIIRFQKELQFNKEFALRLAIFIVDTGTALIITLLTRSPVGLIWGLIAGSIAEVTLSHIFISPQPKFHFNKLKFFQIVKSGKWVTFSGILNYFNKQGVDMVIAKLLNSTALGYYQMAFRFASLPVSELGQITSKVTFPVYVHLTDDPKRLKKAFLRTTAVIAALVLPFCLFVLLFPYLIVNLILGPNWLPTVPLLRILAVYASARAILYPFGMVIYALKRQDLITKSNFIELSALALLIFPLVLKFQTTGAALAALISSFASWPFLYYWLVKLLPGKSSVRSSL